MTVHMVDISQHIKNSSQTDREAAYLACWVMAFRDGRLWREKMLLRGIAEELQLDKKSAGRIERTARGGKKTVSKPKTDAGRQLMFYFAVKVAAADGRLADTERDAIERLALYLETPAEVVDEQLARHGFGEPGNTSESPESDALEAPAGAQEPARGRDLADCLRGLVKTQPDEGNAEPADRWSPLSFSTLRSLLIVGGTYTVSAIALGWQMEQPGQPANDWGLGMALFLAVFAIVFTFFVSFGIGSVGLLIFRWKRDSAEWKEGRTLGDHAGRFVATGLLLIWFGVWFVMPIGILAAVTGGLNVAWLLAHLSLTKSGSRMLVYIEHGATSMAMLFAAIVAATGVWPVAAVLLAFQIFLLMIMDRVAQSGRAAEMNDAFSLENLGIDLTKGWRTAGDLVFRGLLIAGAVSFVVRYPDWQEQEDQRIAQRAARREEARKKKEQQREAARKRIEDFARRRRIQKEHAERVARQNKIRRKRAAQYRKEHPPLEDILPRVGKVNLASDGVYLPTPDRENFRRIFDGNTQTGWTFSLTRSRPGLSVRSKGISVNWDEPRTVNKVVILQRGDNIRGFSITYMKARDNRWYSVGWTVLTVAPKVPTYFSVYDSKKRRSIRRNDLVFINGSSLSKSPRRLGASSGNAPKLIEVFFEHPVETRSIRITIHGFENRPITIQEIQFY